jgi:hypothetical protein
MTLNQIIAQLQSLAQSHKQIRTVAVGDIADLLSNPAILYPALSIDYNQGTIDFPNKQSHFIFQFTLMDLINVSEDARTNEIEVFSDLHSIAADLYALIADYNLQEVWTIDDQVLQVQFAKEKFQDMTGAVMFTIDISTDYLKDVCQVPKN